MKRDVRLAFAWVLFALSSQPLVCAAETTVGGSAPDFTLTDTNGTAHSLAGHKGKFVVLEWFNPDCPFSRKHYQSGNMQRMQYQSTQRGVVWLSIDSSAPGKQGFLTLAQAGQFIVDHYVGSTAVLLDPDGKVGRLYGAKTTPHMFVINPDGVLIYAGAIDDKPSTDPANVAGATNYVQQALEEAMAGKPVSMPETQPYGCSIKY